MYEVEFVSPCGKEGDCELLEDDLLSLELVKTGKDGPEYYRNGANVKVRLTLCKNKQTMQRNHDCAQYSTVRYSTVRYSTVWYSSVHNSIQYSTQFITLQYTIYYSTVQYTISTQFDHYTMCNVFSHYLQS